MANLDMIKKAEAGVAQAKKDLVEAVGKTFVPGTKVTVKGPRGEKETQVINVAGEDLLLETSKGTMKRHYATVKLV